VINRQIGAIRPYCLDVPERLLSFFGIHRSLVVILCFANYQTDINPTNCAMPVAS
jgi:hypothetical protein